LRQEPPEVQEFMLRAAVPSSFTVRSARDVLEVSEAGEMIERLTDEGLLHDQGGGALAFHPLLRSFLRSRLEARQPDVFGEIVANCVAEARQGERWDEAFDLASRAGRRELMVDVVVEAAPNLMDAWRVETLERWLRACERPGRQRADLDVLRGWFLWRAGHFAGSEAVLRRSVEALPHHHHLQSFAWRMLGAGLYSRSCYAESLRAHLQARDLAQTTQDRSRALWAAATAAAVIESDLLESLSAELQRLPPEDVNGLILRAHVKVVEAARSKSLAGTWATIEPLIALTPKSDPGLKPLIRLRFITAAAYVAVSRSEYETARALGEEARALGHEFRIPDWDRPWALIQLTAARLGLRDFAGAVATLKEIEGVRSETSTLLRGELGVLLAKLALAQDGPLACLSLDDRQTRESFERSSRAECAGVVAIAAAAAGDAGRAMSNASSAENGSRIIEAKFYPPWARVITQLVEAGEREDIRAVAACLLMKSASAGLTDPFVLAYRAYPPLLGLLASDELARRVAARLLVAANDAELGRKWGYEEVSVVERRSLLTKRELEVLGLLSDGLTNSQIAERLWVSPSTAKVHVHNVLRKLGVKTRTQAVIAAQRDRWLDAG
jgi:DNA-binding CsgD family transcriptional regulator